MIFHLLLLYEYCGSLYHFICSRRTSKVEETQSNSTDSTEVSGAGLEGENRREKLFIIDMLKGGDADNKPEKVTGAVVDNDDDNDYPLSCRRRLEVECLMMCETCWASQLRKRRRDRDDPDQSQDHRVAQLNL